jgi:hypothetical protein
VSREAKGSTRGPRLDPARLPGHVAVVLEDLDAAARGSVDELVACCAELGIAHLTLCPGSGSREILLGWAAELVEQARARGLDLEVVPNGGREALVLAARRLAAAVHEGSLAPRDVDARRIGGVLPGAGRPDPDLVVCTGGRSRMADFLLWQIAYSELVFSEASGARFGRAGLLEALAEYAGRERRFGKVAERESLAKAG